MAWVWLGFLYLALVSETHPMKNNTTPAQFDKAITELMRTGMTSESYKVILSALQSARKIAEKNLK